MPITTASTTITTLIPITQAETVDAFMKRMWKQDKSTISDADYSTLISIALMGSQLMIQLGGPNVSIPNNK